MLRVLPDLIEEDHVLVIQWDGMPILPDRWDDRFLDFDYIGAPWYGVPDEVAVGNGGFSLRSKRFLHMVRDAGIGINLDDATSQPEDLVICHEHRALLQQLGANFAPIDVARRFSFESGIPTRDVFGFHSTYNFPFFLSEDELLGFADQILVRQTNVKIVALYLENTLRCQMLDLFRLSLEGVVARPLLATTLIDEIRTQSQKYPFLLAKLIAS